MILIHKCSLVLSTLGALIAEKCCYILVLGLSFIKLIRGKLSILSFKNPPIYQITNRYFFDKKFNLSQDYANIYATLGDGSISLSICTKISNMRFKYSTAYYRKG